VLSYLVQVESIPGMFVLVDVWLDSVRSSVSGDFLDDLVCRDPVVFGCLRKPGRTPWRWQDLSLRQSVFVAVMHQSFEAISGIRSF